MPLSTTISGSTATWQYDRDDLLTGMLGLGQNLTIGRDAGNGNITTVSVGNVLETRSYDATYGELSSLVYTLSGASVYSVNYTRDALSRVTQKVETLSGVTTTTSATGATLDTADDTQTERIKPYYLQMRLPSERSDEFVLFRPFVPHSRADSSTPRKQLTAFMVGRSDPGDYGQLVVYTMTTTDSRGGRQLSGGVDGPLTAHENMQSDPTLSQRLTLLDGEGSTVEYGNLVLVPIERGLLYVRPVYVASDASGSARRLRMVVVATGGQVAFGPTLAEALKQLFPTAQVATREEAAPQGPDGPTVNDGQASLAADELIARAVRLFDEADAILRQGGADRLADYQAKIAEAQELVRRAQGRLEERATPVGG